MCNKKRRREIIKEVKALSGITDKKLLALAVAKLSVEPKNFYGVAAWEIYVDEGHDIEDLVDRLKYYAEETLRAQQTGEKTSNQIEMERRMRDQGRWDDKF